VQKLIGAGVLEQEAARDRLLTSDGWQRWLRTRSRFHRYCFLI
jgi:hypothetical protein